MAFAAAAAAAVLAVPVPGVTGVPVEAEIETEGIDWAVEFENSGGNTGGIGIYTIGDMSKKWLQR